MNGRDGNAGLFREYDLAGQADRDVFLKGSNSHYASTAGYAVVLGKYENKAALLDLRPLFQRVREMYFTERSQLPQDPRCGAGRRGNGRTPSTLTRAGSRRWSKSIDVPRPTAVMASLPGGEQPRAFIASRGRPVGVYSVGRPGDRSAGVARRKLIRVWPKSGRPQPHMPGLPEGLPRHHHCRLARAIGKWHGSTTRGSNRA